MVIYDQSWANTLAKILRFEYLGERYFKYKLLQNLILTFNGELTLTLSKVANVALNH